MAVLEQEGKSRGQILLIAAFVLAVIFVGLALVVNSAIFTGNLATRGEVSGSSNALAYQHQMVQSVGEAIAFANVYNTSDPVNSVKQSISDIGVIGGEQQAWSGQLVNVSYVDHVEGTRIADNESGGSAFLPNGSAETYWEVATDVNRARNLVIDITDVSLLETSSSQGIKFIANETGTNTSYWNATIYRDTATNTVNVSVSTANNETAECGIALSGATSFEIDLTRGLVKGKRCHALTRKGPGGTKMWFATGISGSYDLWIENGDEIQGNYSLVTDNTGDANSTNIASGPGSGNPFETLALYQVTIHYVYSNPNVRYEANITVAPGETP